MSGDVLIVRVSNTDNSAVDDDFYTSGPWAILSNGKSAAQLFVHPQFGRHFTLSAKSVPEIHLIAGMGMSDIVDHVVDQAGSGVISLVKGEIDYSAAFGKKRGGAQDIIIAAISGEEILIASGGWAFRSNGKNSPQLAIDLPVSGRKIADSDFGPQPLSLIRTDARAVKEEIFAQRGLPVLNLLPRQGIKAGAKASTLKPM